MSLLISLTMMSLDIRLFVFWRYVLRSSVENSLAVLQLYPLFSKQEDSERNVMEERGVTRNAPLEVSATDVDVVWMLYSPPYA